MTRTEMNVYLAAILTTVAESPDGAPSGVMYAALQDQLGLQDYQDLLTICTSTGLCEKSNQLITLTSKGRDMVSKIKAHSGR